MRLIWSPLSLQRVQEIADYIAADKISAADAWVDTLFNKVEQLKSEPEIGRVAPEIGRSAIRELIFENYSIIYAVSKRQISILTVRHFKQILPVDEVGFQNTQF
jgi:toxin ParE1/3/4